MAAPTPADVQGGEPIQNRNYRHLFFMFDNVGAPITGAWTTPSAIVSIDQGAPITFSGLTAPVQIAGTNMGYLDIPQASVVAANSAMILVTVANANALSDPQKVYFNNITIGTSGSNPSPVDPAYLSMSQMVAQVHQGMVAGKISNDGTYQKHYAFGATLPFSTRQITDNVTIGQGT